MATSNEYIVWGIPGSGKTTYLQKTIENTAPKVGGENILVSSFTRAAAAELTGRDLPIPQSNIGTLHSLCFHALERPQIAEAYIKQFNQENPDCSITEQNVNMDEPETDQPQSGEWDRAFHDYMIARAQLVPREKWPSNVQAIARKWENWKFGSGFLDFTDLIEEALYQRIPPPGEATIGIFDEVQDFTPLQLKLVRSWADRLNHLIIAGDDDQCQTEGTMVLTSNGYKPIEYLDQKIDRLVVYSKRDSQVFGLRHGYEFQIVRSFYKGFLYKVVAGENSTQCTHNHIWIAKWSDKAKDTKTHCVYIMQQGDRFRVGWCKLFRSDGCMHLNVRANLEKAERIWILKVFDDKEEASWYESYIATQYGLPLIIFNGGDVKMKQEGIEYIFNRLDPDIQIIRAARCLDDHGRSLKYPLIDRIKPQNKFGARVMEVRTCNLIAGFMTVPIYEKSKYVRWEPVSFKVDKFEGEVFSLNIEKYHTYIADGIITHNCLYGFIGAQPEVFIKTGIPQENKHYLSQSYRVPKVIQEYARRWIEKIKDREPKEQFPKFDKDSKEIVEGKLSRTNGSYKNPDPILRLIEQDLEAEREVMILASCSYMLSKTIKALKERGIPFHNKYRTKRRDWNPLSTAKKSTASRLLAYLEPAGPTFGGVQLWSLEQLISWVEICKADNVLVRGGKKKILDLKGEETLTDDAYYELLVNTFQPEALDQAVQFELGWLQEKLTAEKRKAAEYPLNVMQAFGRQGLKSVPRVTIGTVHSTKGGQSSHVILFPDLSLNAAQAAQSSRSGRDAVIRQFYVGMTRAAEELTLTDPAGGLYAPII